MNDTSKMLFGAALAAVLPFTALAQDEGAGDAAPSVSSPELEALLLRQKVLEAEQAIATARLEKSKANAARIASILPSSETGGVDGAITVGAKGGYYAEVLAYAALNDAAFEIACQVAELEKKSAVFVDAATYPTLARIHARLKMQLTTTSMSLDGLSNDPIVTKFAAASGPNGFDDFGLNPPKPDRDDDKLGLTTLTAIGSLSGMVTGVLGVARDISQFFQTKLTITGQEISITEGALQTALWGHLKKDGKITLKTPGLAPSNPVGPVGKNTSLLNDYEFVLRNVRELASAKRRISINAKRSLDRIKIQKTQADRHLKNAEEMLKDAVSGGKPASVLNALKSDRDNAVEQVSYFANELAGVEAQRVMIGTEIDTAIAAANTLTTALVTTNDAGVAPIDTLALVDLVKEEGNKITLISASVLTQGAELQTTKKAFSGLVNYVGGVIVSYSLLDHTGDIKAVGQRSVIKTKTFRRKAQIKILEVERTEFDSKKLSNCSTPSQ